MPFVVGLDLSLTSTGIAALEVGTGEMFTHVVRSTGKKDDRLPQHLARLGTLTGEVVEHVSAASPVVVAVESAAFSTRNDSSAHRRAGLWWAVVSEVARRFPVVEVAPSSLKRFATGRGNCDKAAVMLAVSKRWGTDVLPDARSDRADAAALAAMCSYRLGGESLPVTDYRDYAVNRVCWETTHGPVLPLDERITSP